MEKIIIEIHNPLDKSLKKYQAALEQLQKAMNLSDVIQHNHEKTEPTPYRSLHELSMDLRIRVGTGLHQIFRNIVTTWVRIPVTKSMEYPEDLSKATGDDPFKLSDKIYINPKTGRPLTNDEYQEMVKDLNKCFGYLFGETPKALLKRAMALGKVLQSMEPDLAINISLDQSNAIINDVLTTTQSERYQAQQDFAELQTGQMLQDISEDARSKVVSTILTAQREQVSASELERRLFDSFADLNRDWRRVAETESANNFNNGFLTAMLDKAPVGKTLFMKGISGPGACDHCLDNVNEEVVVLLDGPPPGGGQTVSIDGYSYVAIWPGKTNYGRKSKEWWTAAGSQHPHCRCTWIQYIEGFEDVHQKMKEAMEQYSHTHLEA